MKKHLMVLAAAGSLVAAGAVHADAKLAQDKGCLNCHAVAEKKIGPSLKDISAKHKGNAAAPGALFTALREGKGHPKVNASDDEIRQLVAFTLSQ